MNLLQKRKLENPKFLHSHTWNKKIPTKFYLLKPKVNLFLINFDNFLFFTVYFQLNKLFVIIVLEHTHTQTNKHIHTNTQSTNIFYIIQKPTKHQTNTTYIQYIHSNTLNYVQINIKYKQQINDIFCLSNKRRKKRMIKIFKENIKKTLNYI